MRSPMFAPIEITDRRIGCISPVRLSVSTMLGFGVSVTSAPPDRQRDVRERRFDGRVRLVQRHFRPPHPRVREAHIGDACASFSMRSTGSVSIACFTCATRHP